MAEQLTLQQKQAVENRGGKLLVSAAAGSGKTKVLVDRLLSYIMDENDPANLDEFLIITYTKAAAAELRGKISAKLTERITQNPQSRHLQQQMQRLYLAKISTVHSFCSDILREHAHSLDISADFRVVDETEAQELQILAMEHILDAAYERSGEDPDFCAFIDSQGLGRDDRLVPQIVLQVYNSARCHLDPEAWLRWCEEASDTGSISDASQTIWGKYLIEDLHQYLQFQISALTRCVQAASRTEGMEKAAALLENTVRQLSVLIGCTTWDSIVENKQIEYGTMTFAKNCTDTILRDRLKVVRDACKAGVAKKLRPFADKSAKVLADISACGPAARGLISLVRQFGAEYDRRKRGRRVLDFGDLEHQMLDLLKGRTRGGPTSLAYEIGARFREIMVDEYQDSNEVQDAIFDALTCKRNNCFMVGDVKQSIYQFRLADPGIFFDKYKAYEDAQNAKPGQGRKVVLSKNFRSSGGVISAVNDVFATCMSPAVGGMEYGIDEMLHEGIPHIPLGETEVEFHAINVQADTYAEEAAFTAERICQLLDGTHMVRDKNDTLRLIRPEDIVILLRSPGSVGGEFAFALEQRGIRCVTGGNIDLLQTREISTLRSLLQVISNPLQDIPLIAVLSSPVFGFSADELSHIRSIHKYKPFYEMLLKVDMPKARAFLDILNRLRTDARIYTLPQLLHRIFLMTRLDSVFSSMNNGDERASNLRIFNQLVADYTSAGHKDLEQFLEYMDAMEERGLTYAAEQQSAGAVTIMSIHKSKGLEFPVVFLCSLSRSFNTDSLREQVLCHKDYGLGLTCVNTRQRVRYPTIARRAIAAKIISDSISEEMRVLYVAMTRPKDRLIMTYAAKNLTKEISELAGRIDMSGKHLLTADVNCPGKWVLYTALTRTESGALFALGGHPDCAGVREPFWSVHVSDAVEAAQPASVTDDMPECTVEPATIDRLRRSLSFVYPHTAATLTPSKQTATQLKGRLKDQEAAEDTQEQARFIRKFRRPSFAETGHDSIAYGNALHAVMQHIRYDACADLAAATSEIQRLFREGLITAEQVQMVDPAQIASFFQTEPGRKLQCCDTVLREFKFSVLDEGHKYTPGMEEEFVLLQGVVDCAIIEHDGITVIDFKTDHVTQENLLSVAEGYRMQVTAYADALRRIYRLPVKAVMLYFFRVGRFVSMTPK